MTHRQRLMEAARALDVALNLLIGGGRRTISAEMGGRIRRGTASRLEHELCDVLDLVDPGHCEGARRSWLEELAELDDPSDDGCDDDLYSD